VRTLTLHKRIPTQRILCFNCLSSSPNNGECSSKQTCKNIGCDKTHHTVLYNDTAKQSNVEINATNFINGVDNLDHGKNVKDVNNAKVWTVIFPV